MSTATKPPQPTLPLDSWALTWICWYLPDDTLGMTQIHWIPSGSVVGTWNSVQWVFDWSAFILPITKPLLSDRCGFEMLHLFGKIAGVDRNISLQAVAAGVLTGAPLPQAAAVACLKRVGDPGRALGRSHLPFGTLQANDGSRWEEGFRLSVLGWWNILLGGWTSQGITFVPAVWSPTNGTLDPISSVEVLPTISWLYRRRPRRGSTQPLYFFTPFH